MAKFLSSVLSAGAISALLIACVPTDDGVQAVEGETYFPQNVDKSQCSVDQQTFNGWFGGKQPTTPGAPANAADSVDFPIDNSICDFYKWSAQMFLWLTSPEGENYVFDSVEFFDVSPEMQQGGQTVRKLIPNTPGTEGGAYAVRSTKMDEVIGETGQAGGGGVLISQNGSIVYYGIHVNDVYAYYLTGVKSGSITFHDFPNTPDQLKAVVDFAKSQGTTLSDADALTMELKTSWVDVTTVSNPKDYLVINAEVPRYERRGNKVWPVAGTEPKQLALVGMHIVGTVQDHPEMVWATYEHISNAPDAAFSYNNNTGGTTNLPTQNSTGWEFSGKTDRGIQWNAETARVYSGPSDKLPVCKQQTCNPGDIVAYMDGVISPSLTVRMNPWGSATSDAGKKYIQDPDNNAQIISVNNDVMSMLPSGDTRKNYFLVGAVWTQHGNIPTYNSGDNGKFTQKGSLGLANATMETYHQVFASSPQQADAGCFMCHSISVNQAAAKQGVEVSHIFDDILPLPVK
ncbi:hypothetical protein KFE96_15175 [Kordiimonas sp. SCSIO 12603]|uniref:hypothetical protein n=1 Tax=Kordiimonas sp. SCSIO 12603 TaxID=2829596 RepID=UPI0021057CC6|nr:hypothetical protein [Kordiimonas sp. SCSIO 12603]UTW58147.1 hypothetical protein KFE96_15175 [Kordiimonas sp. SCSIO 12603]